MTKKAKKSPEKLIIKSAKWLIALDVSLTSTGIVVATKNKVLHCSAIKVKPLGMFPAQRIERYQIILNNILKIIRKFSAKTKEIPAIFIEGFSYGSQGRSVINIGELGGIVRNHFIAELGYGNFHEIPPTSLKLFVTGKGNTNKIMMVSTMTKKYNRIFETDDEADAFALADLGGCLLGWRTTKTDYEKRALKKITESE